MLSTSTRARADLDLVVAGHVNSLTGFVLPRVLPLKDAKKATARYFKVPAGVLLDTPDTERAPGGDFKRDNYGITDSTVTTKGKGLEAQIPVEQSAEYADIFDLEAHRSIQKVNQILRREEVNAAATLFNRTTFPVAAASGHDCSNEFDDHVNATPVDEVTKALDAIEANIGDWREMGLQVCGLGSRRTIRHMKLCAQVRSGLGGIYTDPQFRMAEFSDDILADTLNLDEIVVANKMQKTGGTDLSPTTGKIWDDEFFLVFVRSNPTAPETMGLGLTFYWTPGGGEIEVETYWENQTDSQIVKVKRQSVQEIVQSGAGYLIGNCKS